MFRRLARVAVATLGAFGPAACSGDDGTGTTPAAPEPAGGALSVVAKDIDFSRDAFQAGAGPVSISYRNEGSLPHTLVIEGEAGFKLQVGGKGDVDRGSVDLAPGTYTVYCDIVGHRQAGMVATLTVA